MKSKRKSSFFFHVLGISFFPDTFFAPQELTFLSDFYVIIEHRFLEERIFGNEWQKKIRHQ
ncbi:hypothetical protein A3P32_04820 [Lactobacillus johnsonii]|nr:hypothetical protein A3P32_04820 [Lactobacillus johnsonii]